MSVVALGSNGCTEYSEEWDTELARGEWRRGVTKRGKISATYIYIYKGNQNKVESIRYLAIRI